MPPLAFVEAIGLKAGSFFDGGDEAADGFDQGKTPSRRAPHPESRLKLRQWAGTGRNNLCFWHQQQR